MYKRMVVLLDGSELAEVVFDYAQELSGRMQLEVELLHVCNPNETSQLPMRRAYMERMAEELCAKAEEIKKKYDPDAMAHCIQAHGSVVVGYPAEEILTYVEDKDIDLVMMSTHGSSGAKEWALGDVANKVVHASKVPVWLVPTELRKEVIADAMESRTIVIPLSGTEASSTAIPHALDIISQRGAESDLVLLHVLEDPLVMEYVSMSRAALSAREEHKAKMKAYLENLAQPIRESGIAVATELLTGEPDRAIIEYLKSNPSQLLVMAARGKSRLNRMIFGSVTEGVMQMVKVTPMLLVSGEAQRDQ